MGANPLPDNGKLVEIWENLRCRVAWEVGVGSGAATSTFYNDVFQRARYKKFKNLGAPEQIQT